MRKQLVSQYDHNVAIKRLTKREQAAWRGFLDVHAAIELEMESRLAPTGLGTNDYGTLVLLEEAGEEGARMADVAARIGMTASGFTRLADRLEKRRLIERRRCPDDGRGAIASITSHGAKQLMAARKTHLDDVRELFLSKLSADELDQLKLIWEKLRDQPPG